MVINQSTFRMVDSTNTDDHKTFKQQLIKSFGQVVVNLNSKQMIIQNRTFSSLSSSLFIINIS